MKFFRFGLITLLGVFLLLRLLLQNRSAAVTFVSNNQGSLGWAVPSSYALLQPVSEDGQDDDCAQYRIQDQVISEGEVHLNLQVPTSINLVQMRAHVQMQFQEVGVSEIMIGVLDATNQPHYVPLYNRYLEDLGWHVIEAGGVSLYQRITPPPLVTYESIPEFLGQLGSNQVTGAIAVYGYPATASYLPLERALALDAIGVDYIIANYTQPERSGDTYITRQTLDVAGTSTAYGIVHLVLTISGSQRRSAHLLLDSLQVEWECQ